MSQRFERLAELLAVADPPAAVELLLQLLIETNDAASGAALVLSGGRLVLQAVRMADPALVAQACSRWPALEGRLRSGAAVAGPGHVLLPLRHEDALVGALYLETDKPVDLAPQAQFTAALARALANSAWRVRAQPDERQLLRRVLEESEWNVSRASRALGVTRRTVYLRMKRLGIPRRKRSDGSA